MHLRLLIILKTAVEHGFYGFTVTVFFIQNHSSFTPSPHYSVVSPGCSGAGGLTDS